MTWKSWTNGILGVWLFAAAFLGLGQTGNFWNDLIVGIIVAVVGFMMITAKSWQGWTAGILGLWLIIAAFIPGLLTGAGLIWNNILVGLIVAVAGFAALSSSNLKQGTGNMHEKMAH